MGFFSRLLGERRQYVSPHKAGDMRIVECTQGWKLQVYDDGLESDFGYWVTDSTHKTVEEAKNASRIHKNPQIINLNGVAMSSKQKLEALKLLLEYAYWRAPTDDGGAIIPESVQKALLILFPNGA